MLFTFCNLCVNIHTTVLPFNERRFNNRRGRDVIMKKVYSLLVIPMLIFGMMAIASEVSAQTVVCDNNSINNTGAGSTNTITCKTDTSVVVECNNNVNITFNDSQISQTGDVEVNGNTIGGNATSGNSINEKASGIDVAAVCAALEKPVTPPVTPTPVTPEAVTPTPAPQPAPSVAVLPETSNSATSIEKAAVFAAAAGAIAFTVMLSAKLYRRFNS